MLNQTGCFTREPNLLNSNCLPLIQIWISNANLSLIFNLNRWLKFKPAVGSSPTWLKYIWYGPSQALFTMISSISWNKPVSEQSPTLNLLHTDRRRSGAPSEQIRWKLLCLSWKLLCLKRLRMRGKSCLQNYNFYF